MMHDATKSQIQDPYTGVPLRLGVCVFQEGGGVALVGTALSLNGLRLAAIVPYIKVAMQADKSEGYNS